MRKGWDKRKLGDISELVTKGTTPTSVGFDFVTSGINFVKVESISSTGEFIQDKFAHITRDCHESLKRSQLEPGDILFSIAGALGRTAIVTSNIIPANTNQALAIIRLKKGIGVFDRFVLAALQAGSIFEQIEKFKGGVAQLNLSLAQVRDLLIPLPPLEEQQRIVSILDEAFAELASAQAHAARNLQNARALFESHLQSVFTQRGEGWVETTLGEVYDVRDGTHDSPKYQATGYPLITSKNLKSNGISFDDVKLISKADFDKINERSVVHRGDVLLAMIGTIGNPTIVEVDSKFAIKNVALFKVSDCQSSGFLKNYLDSEEVKSKMTKEAKGTTQKFVGLGYLRGFPIFLPSLEIQNAIVRELDALSSETQHLTRIYEQKLAALAALKKSLLHQAFSGEL